MLEQILIITPLLRRQRPAQPDLRRPRNQFISTLIPTGRIAGVTHGCGIGEGRSVWDSDLLG